LTKSTGKGKLNQTLTRATRPIEGVKEALVAFPDIELVATEGTEDDLARAVSVTEALLRANPDLNGIFGVSQVGGPAVSKVMAQQEFANFAETLTVFAFDDLPDTLKGVQDGFIDGIMVQRPVTMGRLAVEHLTAQVKGDETVSEDVDTGVTVVNADNLDSYTK
jgi:ribose transport system substrate-binding protein